MNKKLLDLTGLIKIIKLRQERFHNTIIFIRCSDRNIEIFRGFFMEKLNKANFRYFSKFNRKKYTKIIQDLTMSRKDSCVEIIFGDSDLLYGSHMKYILDYTILQYDKNTYGLYKNNNNFAKSRFELIKKMCELK